MRAVGGTRTGNGAVGNTALRHIFLAGFLQKPTMSHPKRLLGPRGPLLPSQHVQMSQMCLRFPHLCAMYTSIDEASFVLSCRYPFYALSIEHLNIFGGQTTQDCSLT